MTLNQIFIVMIVLYTHYRKYMTSAITNYHSTEQTRQVLLFYFYVRRWRWRYGYLNPVKSGGTRQYNVILHQRHSINNTVINCTNNKQHCINNTGSTLKNQHQCINNISNNNQLLKHNTNIRTHPYVALSKLFALF